MYLGFLYVQQEHPNDTFIYFQLLVFSIISILTVILALSSYSLKKEISRQQSYLEERKQTMSTQETVKIPYNKSGLYSVILVTIIGMLIFLYLYNEMILHPPTTVGFMPGTLETLSMIFFIIILILLAILLATLFLLMKRIQAPLYYDYKPCPRCASSDIHKVDYSWWGGLIGPALVHQVRCKKCGKIYDGTTGKDISRRLRLYLIVMIALFLLIMILQFIL
jgi:hypothetical protein